MLDRKQKQILIDGLTVGKRVDLMKYKFIDCETYENTLKTLNAFKAMGAKIRIRCSGDTHIFIGHDHYITHVSIYDVYTDTVSIMVTYGKPERR